MVIVNNRKLKTLDGIEYKFPENLYYILKEAINRSNQKLDNVIIITGGVGSGKSNLSKGASGTYNEVLRKVPYTLDDVYFLIEKVLASFDADDNKGAPINYDEAVQGASGRDGITKLGKKLRKAFITKRTKRHLITLCVDNPKELNDKIIERCIAWYHVFMVRTAKGKYVKGLFKVFSKEDLRMMYNDLKSNKFRYVEAHPMYKKNRNIYKSYDYSKLFYSDEDYDTKKSDETGEIEDEKNDKMMIQRDNAILLLLKSKKYTLQTIGTAVGLGKSTISDIKAKNKSSVI